MSSQPEPRPYDVVLGGQSKKPQQLSLFETSPRAFDGVLGFVPSPYQRRIFDWIREEEGSCVVSAVPGSGKTTTLIKAAQQHIKKGTSVRFLAFNQHIAQELKSKLPKHIKAGTIHSLGYSALFSFFRGQLEICSTKYTDLLIDLLRSKNIKLPPSMFKGIRQLIKFAQLTLTPVTPEALKELALSYDLYAFEDWDFASYLVEQVLMTGLNYPTISYEDMLWMPIKFGLSLSGYDFILVDEAQDLNRAQLEIVLKTHRAGSRGIFVGDENQAILGFTASDYRSIKNICDRTGAIRLPLSICYRCPTSHIELANKIHNVIESKPGAIEGEVYHIDSPEIPEVAKPGDLIICRCLYPVISVYYELLKAGIPAKVKNQDISQQLLNLLEQLAGATGVEYGEFSTTEFTDRLNHWFEVQRQDMLKSEVSLLRIFTLHDKVKCLIVMYEGNQCKSVVDLREAIERLSQDKRNTVVLTTIHGGKGLEAERVIFLKPQLVPHPKATSDSELEQEQNLKFVALTRAKRVLYFAN